MQEEVAHVIAARAQELGYDWLAKRIRVAKGTRTRVSVPVGRGKLTIDTAAAGQVFLVQIWQGGYSWISGKLTDLNDLVRFAVAWEGGISLTEAVRRWPMLEYDWMAAAYEQGNEVAVKWEMVRAGSEARPMRELIELAYARPKLRILFPWVGQVGARLGFSRCTGYPFTNDIPVVDLSADGFLVRDLSRGVVIGEFSTAFDAIDMVDSTVPASVGPAVPGTAEDLQSTE